ncbi:hypothetical protein BGZ83_003425 [Gryganskiella cystojenkinii]|nr:hypothetical protein BGZ83_003425 [Gryganskiella cystojenkinii]
MAPYPLLPVGTPNSSPSATLVPIAPVAPFSTVIPTGAPAPNTGDTTNNSNNSNTTLAGDGNDNGFQTSGGYIWIILTVSFLVALIYFGRVILAKRRAKRRLLKERECEVPPDYYMHLSDRRVVERTPSQSRAGISSIPRPLPLPAPQVQPPSAARLRSSDMFDPPAYDDLLVPKPQNPNDISRHPLD